MAWFFADTDITTESYTITGEDAAHISRSLRMREGEALTLCTPDGRRHECEIASITRDTVSVRVLSSTVCEQEPTLRVTLCVAMMKGDKLDDVIQKAVELGVYEIIPFLSARCISRPDEKSLLKKLTRWQKIADNAASQSRRGIIPQVRPCTTIEKLPEVIAECDRKIVFYECGGEPMKALIPAETRSVALITGAEGGFEETEIETLRSNGISVATLGKRILRAQTAPIAALCAAMLLTGNLD
jgi:16S rRNA (uracil1498-N3)-methyltransferase